MPVSGCGGSGSLIFGYRCQKRWACRLCRLAGSVSNRCFAAVWLHRRPFGKTVGYGGRRLAGFALRGGRKIQSAQNGGPVRFRMMRPASAGGSKSGRVLPHRVGRSGGRFCIGRVRAGTSRSSSPLYRMGSAQSEAGCRRPARWLLIGGVSYGIWRCRLLSGYFFDGICNTHSGWSVPER